MAQYFHTKTKSIRLYSNKTASDYYMFNRFKDVNNTRVLKSFAVKTSSGIGYLPILPYNGGSGYATVKGYDAATSSQKNFYVTTPVIKVAITCTDSTHTGGYSTFYDRTITKISITSSDGKPASLRLPLKVYVGTASYTLSAGQSSASGTLVTSSQTGSYADIKTLYNNSQVSTAKSFSFNPLDYEGVYR